MLLGVNSVKAGDFVIVENDTIIVQDKPWLDNIWVLEEIRGTKVDLSTPNGEKPNLTIKSIDRRFSGYLGCNRMGGSIFVEDNQVKFTGVTATRMSCEIQSFEMQFINVLLTVTQYGIIEDRLYLSNPDGVLLVLVRS
jgi:heat shock protein HslJ